LIAYLKGVCHASFSTTRKYLRDVVKVSISRGQLAKVIGKVSAALQGPYQELLEALPGEPTLNVDETGHKDRKARMWAWCFRAELYTLFKIDARRSALVLMEVLGQEFDGRIAKKCSCWDPPIFFCSLDLRIRRSDVGFRLQLKRPIRRGPIPIAATILTITLQCPL
jgi:hypothetical protein